MKEINLVPRPKRLECTGGVVECLPRKTIECYGGTSEAYLIQLTSSELILRGSVRGLARAESTLYQLTQVLQRSGALPCMRIEDEPDLPVRGFMLDISRGRVPNRRMLRQLVHWLWLLKFNQLQLYMEHTFAYHKHAEVWQNVGALDASDLQWLDKLCESYGIELVPNQNTFGHMEQWLKHASYKHLAESPAGYRHPILGWRTSGGVLRPGKESADFIQGLLEELLPNFRSDQVHIGGDETWELGEGASRDEAQRVGKSAVFEKHLRRLVGIAKDLGKRPQFWADVFIESSATEWDAYADCLPVVWGYEPGHPFANALESLRRAELPALVAPGTSAWNSFWGRWECARRNISEANDVCRQFDGPGFLLTSWGDNGHGYPAPVMWPPMIQAGALGWSGSMPEILLKEGLFLLNGIRDEGAADALMAVGTLDSVSGSSSPNMSGIYRSALGIELSGIENPYTSNGFKQESALEFLNAIRESFSRDDASPLSETVDLVTDLAEWAIIRASGKNIPAHLETLGERFKGDWERTAQSPLPLYWRDFFV